MIHTMDLSSSRRQTPGVEPHGAASVTRVQGYLPMMDDLGGPLGASEGCPPVGVGLAALATAIESFGYPDEALR